MNRSESAVVLPFIAPSNGEKSLPKEEKIRADKDTKIKNLKPKEKAYKAADSGGLYLLVTPSGGKHWHMKYRFPKGGKEKLASFGSYPLVSLADAREMRDAAKKHLANNIDPAQVKALAKARDQIASDNSFKSAALEYIKEKVDPTGDTPWSKDYAFKCQRRLERFAYPAFGSTPVVDIEVIQVVAAMKTARSKSGADMAERLGTDLKAIFRYAIQHGWCPKNHANPAGDLKGVITVPKSTPIPSIREPKRVGEVMHLIAQDPIDNPKGNPQPQTIWGVRFLTYVWCRPIELRKMEWTEIDWEKGHWLIPASKMKMKKKHEIPLSKQALAILKTMQPITGDQKYVFGGIWGKKYSMMSNMTLNNYLKERVGISPSELTPHGFRSMGRTMCEERLNFPPKVCEIQLSHVKEDDNYQGAYDRTEHWDARVEMMQKWADYIDDLRAQAALRLGSTANEQLATI